MNIFKQRGGARGAVWLTLLVVCHIAVATETDAEKRATFAELWQQVERTNPELSAVAAEATIAAGGEIQAMLRPNPVLQISTENAGTNSREDTVGVAQTIELGGKRAARTALASTQVMLASGLLAQKRAELYSDFRQAFLALLATRERHKLAVESLALIRQDLASVQQQIVAGRLPSLALKRTRVELTTVELQAKRAETDVSRAQRRLGALLGRSIRNISIHGSLETLPHVPGSAELEEALAAAPAVRAAGFESARRAAEIRVEESKRHGDLTLGAGVRYLAGSDEPAGVLTLSIPLAVSDRNQGNLARARGAAEQAASLESAVRLQIARDVEDAILRFDTATRAVADIQGTIVPEAQTTLDATRRGFALGKFGLTELLDARRVLLQTRSQLIDALMDAHLAATDITRVLGDHSVTFSD